MRVNFVPAMLVTAALVGSGCSAFVTPHGSAFFSKFSLQAAVEKNASRSGLDCPARGGGGIGSSGGGLGFGGSEYQSHRGEICSCRLAGNGEGFAEAGFISALRRDVEGEITGSGAKITGSDGQDTGGFSFKYALADMRGRVNVTGRRIGGGYYSVEAELDESGGKRAK